MGDPRRTYFDIDTTSYVQGVPRVQGPATGLPACPHCGCKRLFDIVVDVKADILRGGVGVGHYTGCPACPFATPMLMVATTTDAPR